MTYIRALDGTRGVAVALVCAYHFGVPWLEGGFLGVDLFFVLSGFLITTLLLDEHQAAGRIDLVQFWFRRARRLLPALFVLIAAVGIWTAVAATPVEKGPLRWDLLASLGYVANWRFLLAGQSYFSDFVTASPVRHLWSLSIEEQFYVVWPLLVTATFAAVHIRIRLTWRTAAVLLAVGAIASAALMAALYDEANPSNAYYNTFARAHELLIGALAAVVLSRVRPIRAAFASHASWIAVAGLAGVLAASILASDTTPFYYHGGSVVFAVASVLLILALVVGNPGRGPAHRALRLGPIVWLGAISYGVYLWHWPMTVWLTPDRVGVDGPMLLALRTGTTLLIATASYYLVERPIRRGALGPVRLRPAVALAAAAFGFTVLSAGSVLATRGWEPPPAFLSDESVLQVHDVEDGRATIGIVGDSVALSIYSGMWRIGDERGFSTVSASVAGCGVGEALRIEDDGTLQWKTEHCAETVPALQSEMVADYDPEVIYWHSQRDRQDIRDGDRNLEAPTAPWKRALFDDWDATLDRLQAGGATVVLLLPLFTEKTDPTECSGIEDLVVPACVDPVMSNGALRTIYLEWASAHRDDGLVIMDYGDRLCPDAPCPPIIDGVNLRRDHIHFSSTGAQLLSGWMIDDLPPGVLR